MPPLRHQKFRKEYANANRANRVTYHNAITAGRKHCNNLLKKEILNSQQLHDRDAVKSHVCSTRSIPKLLELEEVIGDIFKAPTNSVLIHACNCKGSWGAGIAASFKNHYPSAYRKYKAHCDNFDAKSLAGTAYLIRSVDWNGCQHYIGCLFTSIGFGKWKDSPLKILSNTESAMKDLLEQITALRDKGNELGDIQMCQINSGYFGVPWEDTKALLEAIEIRERGQYKISVISRT